MQRTCVAKSNANRIAHGKLRAKDVSLELSAPPLRGRKPSESNDVNQRTFSLDRLTFAVEFRAKKVDAD